MIKYTYFDDRNHTGPSVTGCDCECHNDGIYYDHIDACCELTGYQYISLGGIFDAKRFTQYAKEVLKYK